MAACDRSPCVPEVVRLPRTCPCLIIFVSSGERLTARQNAVDDENFVPQPGGVRVIRDQTI